MSTPTPYDQKPRADAIKLPVSFITFTGNGLGYYKDADGNRIPGATIAAALNGPAPASPAGLFEGGSYRIYSDELGAFLPWSEDVYFYARYVNCNRDFMSNGRNIKRNLRDRVKIFCDRSGNPLAVPVPPSSPINHTESELQP